MQDALRKNLVSGSTATAVLLADGQIFTANIGDSKSLLCSENIPISDSKGRNFFVESTRCSVIIGDNNTRSFFVS